MKKRTLSERAAALFLVMAMLLGMPGIVSVIQPEAAQQQENTNKIPTEETKTLAEVSKLEQNITVTYNEMPLGEGEAKEILYGTEANIKVSGQQGNIVVSGGDTARVSIEKQEDGSYKLQPTASNDLSPIPIRIVCQGTNDYNEKSFSFYLHYKQKALNVTASFEDKTYDGTTEAELKNFEIAESDLAEQDRKDADEIKKAIEVAGSFASVCAKDSNDLSVGITVTPSFKNALEWEKKYELKADFASAHINQAELTVSDVKIKEKVYDRTKTAEVMAFQIQGDFGKGDAAEEIQKKIEAAAQYADGSVGENKKAEITAVFQEKSGYECKYHLKIVGDAFGKVIPKEVQLSVDQDYTVSYSNFKLEDMQKVSRVELKKADLVQGEDASVLFTLESRLPKTGLMGYIPKYDDQPCMTPSGGLPVIGIVTDGFTEVEKDQRFEQVLEDTNYKFVFDIRDRKNLFITAETINIKDYIQISDRSGRACQDKKDDLRFWVGEGGTLYLEPKENDEGKYYSCVIYTDDHTNLTEDGINYENTGTDTRYICLIPQDPDNKIPVQEKGESDTVGITARQDSTAPEVKVQMGSSDTAVTKALENITFGVYRKEVMTASIAASDKESGIDSVEYAVYQVRSDDPVAGGALTEEQQTIFLANLKWKDLSCSDEGRATVKEYVESPDEELNYILVVKATDRVGNGKAYCSNGVVIDVRQPVIDITFASDIPISDYGIYSTDVKAKVHVKEQIYESDTAGKVYSGIQSLKYEIYKNGETKKEWQNTLIDKERKDIVLKNLHQESLEFTKEFMISAEDFNSNDIKIVVIAKDQSGNEARESRSIKIDKTASVSSISYTSEAKAENDRYYRENRTAKVTVKERNFNPSAIRFCLKKENTPVGEYTLEQLGQQLGIHVRWQDSQMESIEEQYSDSRINTAVITFSRDDHYTFDLVSATDKADNSMSKRDFADNRKNEKANTYFVIDKTAPVLRITYGSDGKTVKPGRSQSGRIYKNKTISAYAAIEEHNFVLPGKEVNSNVRLVQEKTKAGAKVQNVDKFLKKASSWGSNTDLRTAGIDFTEDSNYTLYMDYTDLAGNKAIYKDAYFTVDKTLPTGTVTVGELGSFRKFIKYITFGLFDNKAQRVTLTGADATSPVKKISYYKSRDILEKKDLEGIKNKKWKSRTVFSMKTEEEAVVYGRITDQAGNIRYISSNGVILDTAKPVPTIKISTAEPAHGVFGGDINVKISVVDPVSGDTYAGLRAVSYEVLNGKSATQRGNFDADLQPASKRVKEITRTITVDAQKNNTNDVTVKVTAIDNAGNVSLKEEKMKIDIAKPEITVTYSNNSPAGGKFYKDTRTATITVKERNFDQNNVQFSITNTDGTRPSVSGWSSGAGAGVSDDAVNTCTVSFEADGDYTFTLSCTDLAGNKGDYGKTDTFTIDKTMPQIQVSYDENEPYSSSYYNTARTATVMIKEHNFDAADVKTAIGASLNKQGIASPSIGRFTSNGDSHSAVISYVSDGDYTFGISYTDQAGNAAADYAQESFTIDTEVPKVKISGLKKANKGTVAPVIEYTDANTNPKEVEIILKGYRHDEVKIDGTASPVTSGERIQLNDFVHTEDVDDIYTLTAKVTDKAGNDAEAEFTFSVNRFGSVYVTDEATKGLLEQYYINSASDLVVTETNADTLDFQQITCSRDGKVIELERGKQYLVEEKGSDQEWKVYKYIINKNNFKEDGKYAVTIYSEDKAENTSSSQAKGKSIEFVVDRTLPTVVITGIETGAQYKEDTHEIIVDAKDNIQLESLRIESLAEGKETPEVYEFSKEELKANYGSVKKALFSCNTWQTVKVSATDSAGNIYSAQEIRVLISPSLWIQFYMNKPLFIGAVTGIVLFIGVILLLLNKKKKKACQ